MLLALLALLIVALVLALPSAGRALGRLRRRARKRRAARARQEALTVPDPGRERRAEQRARELLRSCVNEEEWAMYRDLGFIRVHGTQTAARRSAGAGEVGSGRSGGPKGADGLEPHPGRRDAAHRQSAERRPSYAYLIYPQKPIVAFVPETRQLLSEYCVEFPELAAAVSRTRLPDSDDVLAKWMALTGDERRLIADANMHLPGRQVDPARVRRDIWRLAEWERQRGGQARTAARG
jgi:hypothetical protein